MARVRLGEIGADDIRIGLRGFRLVRGRDLFRREEEQGIALEQHRAGRPGERMHAPRHGGGDEMLHLHRFQHGDGRALAHDVARLHVDGDDLALHRRGDGNRAGRRGGERRGGRGLRCGDRHRVRRFPIGGFGDQRRGVLLDIARMGAAFADVLAGDQRVQEAEIGRDAGDHELVQRPRRPRHRGGVVGAVHDQLGE